MRSPKLLDLPDEILSKILSHLLPSPETLSPTRAPPAHAFSQTCVRLHTLFAEHLHTLNLQHPTPPTYPPTLLSPLQKTAHQAALLRLSLPHLHTLHLPATPPPTHLLPLLESAPRLSILSVVDAGALPHADLRSLHVLSSTLSKLSIHDPRASLHAFDTLWPRLHTLILTALRPFALPALTLFLRLSGSNLRTLSIQFLPDPDDTPHTTHLDLEDPFHFAEDPHPTPDQTLHLATEAPNHPIGLFHTLATYLSENAAHDLPNLHTLSISTTTPQALRAPEPLPVLPDRPDQPPAPYAALLSAHIHASRKSIRYTTRPLHAIHLLTLQTTYLYELAHIIPLFVNQCATHAEISAHFPGACITIEPGLDARPTYTELLFTHDALRHSPPDEQLTRLHTVQLDVRSSAVQNRDLDTLRRVLMLAARTLRLFVFSTWPGEPGPMLDAVRDGLGEASCLEEVQVPVAAFNNLVGSDFRQLARVVVCARVLRITRREGMFSPRALAIALPWFLRCISEENGRLECVCLEVDTVDEEDMHFRIKPRPPTTEDALVVRCALVWFRKRMPEVEIGGLVTLVEEWLGGDKSPAASSTSIEG